MAHVSSNDMDTAQSPRFETPTFDPRSAFSWTLRAGEIARLDAQQRRNGLPDPKKLESRDPDVTQVRDNETSTAQYETPTFDPRSAFSWMLRAGEIARLEPQRRRNRLPLTPMSQDPKQLSSSNRFLSRGRGRAVGLRRRRASRRG